MFPSSNAHWIRTNFNFGNDQLEMLPPFKLPTNLVGRPAGSEWRKKSGGGGKQLLKMAGGCSMVL